MAARGRKLLRRKGEHTFVRQIKADDTVNFDADRSNAAMSGWICGETTNGAETK
uniref:Uncharacterized protein n=1 Tax=Cucumis melo TaxID=3656 RepID=A0A9I9DH25_CUCME